MENALVKPEMQAEENKHLFGAYLNMARNNLRLILEYVDEKVSGYSRKMNEDALQASEFFKLLRGQKKPDVQKRALDLLKRQLPFLKLLVRFPSTASPTDYADALEFLICRLNELRNEHAHFLHQTSINSHDFTESLRFLFDAARRKTKVRFRLEPEEMAHLVRKTLTGRGKDRKVVERTNFQFAFAEADGRLKEKGLAFFICLFLERRYAQLFLQQLRGFKDSRTRNYRATLETYSILGIRLPKQRLQSDNSKEALLLDMIEELKRCPAALFELLSEEDQNRFRVMEEDADGEWPLEVLQKRSGDRFPYFTLRFFEVTNELSSLQFYADLGKFNHTIYEKEVSGEMRLRQWQQHLKGFGRLHHFEPETMPPSWNALVKKSQESLLQDSEPHIVFTFPHYHFVNHSIGLRFSSERILPDLSKKKNLRPEAWLSLYELPAMVFLHLLTRNGDESQALWTLRKHRANCTRFFSAIADGKLAGGWQKDALLSELEKYKIGLHQIPKVLQDYLMGVKRSQLQLKAERKLKWLITETTELLTQLEADIERAKEKPGSKKHKLVQTGKIADFMARDMLRLQPPVAQLKGKATSTLFQVLQARLAFYGRDKNLLADTYKECNLISSDNPHPFLGELELTHTIVDYYRNYLKRRKKYLESLLLKCAKGQLNSPAFHFLHLGERERKDQPDYFVKLASKFLEMPFNLPRGLFLQSLRDHFIVKGPESIGDKLKAGEKVNAVYLLHWYLAHELQDSPQEFYEWPRSYYVLNQLFRHGAPKLEGKNEKLYLAPKELAIKAELAKEKIALLPTKTSEQSELKDNLKDSLRFLSNTEKTIRHTKACDISLFLMVKDLLVQLDNTMIKRQDVEAMQLRDIGPNAQKGILSVRITCRFKAGEKTLLAENIKLKNYGTAKKILKDNRLPTLLSWYPENEIKIVDVEKEFHDYDRARIKMQALVLAFEARCVTQFGMSIPTGETHLVHELILQEWVRQGGGEVKRRKMIKIRNAFMHNQYPEFENLKNDIGQGGFIASKLVKLYEELSGVEGLQQSKQAPGLSISNIS